MRGRLKTGGWRLEEPPAGVLAIVLLCCAGCSSTPEMDRPQVPDRPEVQRPDGVEPEGLADIRDSIGVQRAAARERENALLMRPNELSTTTTTPWYETLLTPFADLMDIIRGLCSDREARSLQRPQGLRDAFVRAASDGAGFA